METPKLLLVDDRIENLVALEKVLSGIDAVLVRAHSGNEALSLCLDQEFALALIDVQMPGMDGFETVEILRQDEKMHLLPVIFVSAVYSEEFYKIKGIESGAVDFITKPIIPQILRGKVQTFLQLYMQRKRLEEALKDIRILKGLLPICANCKKIRNERGHWQSMEAYMHEHAEVDFTHGIALTA